ncbi:hypothetical protein [Chryseobacterium scophthalmum]|uniref:hypothetical protein n=1 Tax=Chryseobacterium scophthalmum TaxID=59733 RepID=UPI003D0219A8
MKKILLITAIFFGTLLSFAQVPEKMSYQAVIRNTSGQLLQNQNVAVKVSVLQGSSSGTVAYSERLMGTTNTNGLISLEIGTGTVLSGIFNTIDWSVGNYYLKTETDPNGGTNYTIAGTSQLLSVPYAMYAKASGSGGTSQWATNENDISNTNTGNVGIGTLSPSNKLTVKSDGMGITQESPNGNVRMGFFVNNTTAFLQTHTNHDLNFATNDATDFQIKLQKGTGNFGIGKTPVEKLDVGGKTKTETLQVTTGGGLGKVLTSDGVGNATWQNVKIPSGHFRARLLNGSASIPYNMSTVIKWTAADIHEFPTSPSGYNPSTGVYTIPEDGYYSISFEVSPSTESGNVDGVFTVGVYVDQIGFVAYNYYNIENTKSVNGNVNVHTELFLTQGSGISFRVTQSYKNGTINIGSLTQCGIHLIHK